MRKTIRRTKMDMIHMNNDCRYYLLQTKLDPHSAHEKMIKECLEDGRQIPYYIKGVADFIKVSQELAVELGNEEHMKKKDQEKHEAKMNVVDYIMEMTLDEIKSIYKEYKDIVSHSDKLVLHNLYMQKWNTEYPLERKHIDQHMINVFSKIQYEKSAS